MNPNDETIIALSKTKLVLLLLGSAAFVAAGAWLLSLDPATVRSHRAFGAFFNDPLFARGLGLLSILFFGICGAYALKALFDKKPGLVLNDSGFVDNASAVAAGFIPWSEVVGVGVFEVNKQRTLIVEVADPQKYVGRGGALRRALNKANYKLSGSPITIPSTALSIGFPELVSLFDRYRQTYGARPPGAVTTTAAHGSSAPPPEVPRGDTGHGDAYVEPGARPRGGLLDWSPGAVKGTVGAGGIGILVLAASSLDQVFRVKVPFWAAFTVSLLPMFIFFIAAPDMLPQRVVRPAQWLAAVLYLTLSALSVSLAAWRGLAPVDLLLVGFVGLGAWPCLVAVRRLRAARGA